MCFGETNTIIRPLQNAQYFLLLFTHRKTNNPPVPRRVVEKGAYYYKLSFLLPDAFGLLWT